MDEYWNHNSAYHPFLVETARRQRGIALDVGCGEGLLVQRLADACSHVTGIDPDGETMMRARIRVEGRTNVTLHQGDFLAVPLTWRSYDLVTFVATLHHMDTAAALERARDVLKPGGELFVVGLAANKTIGDWLLSGLQLPLVRVLSHLHRERRDLGVATSRPRESLAEIRAHARKLLPGASVRRGVYYRYLLKWTKPLSA